MASPLGKTLPYMEAFVYPPLILKKKARLFRLALMAVKEKTVYTAFMKKGLCITALAGLILFSALPARGEKLAPGWTLGQSLSGALNPLAAEYAVRVYHSLPLFPQKTGILWDSARIEGGLHNALTPAYDTLSVFARIEPLAVFDLQLMAGVRAYYDLFGFGFTPLSGFDAPFDAPARGEIKRSEQLGFRYAATPTVKGALGPFLFSHSVGLVLLDTRGAAGLEDFYYEPVSNAVLGRLGGYITNDSLLGYNTGRGIIAGLAHSFLYVPASSYVSQKLVGVFQMGFPRGEKTAFSAALLGGVFLRDRYYSYRDGKIYLAAQLGMTRKI